MRRVFPFANAFVASSKGRAQKLEQTRPPTVFRAPASVVLITAEYIAEHYNSAPTIDTRLLTPNAEIKSLF